MDNDEEVKYAVVRVKGKDKAVGLLQFLLANGYSDVSFVSDLLHVGFKSDPVVDPSSSKVTSSSAVGPSTSAVSTTTDPIPSTPPHSSNDSIEELDLKKTEPVSPSHQPSSRAASPQDKNHENSTDELREPRTPDPQPSISTSATGQVPQETSPQQVDEHQGDTEQKTSDAPIDKTAPSAVTPVKIHRPDASKEVNDAVAAVSRTISAIGDKRKHTESTSTTTTTLSFLPPPPPTPFVLPLPPPLVLPPPPLVQQRWNQQVKPTEKASSSTPSPAKKPSQWLQKPQPTVETATTKRADQPIIFDPAKWQLARERAEAECKDTSYNRKKAASSSSGPSTSSASTVGSASTSTAPPPTISSPPAPQNASQNQPQASTDSARTSTRVPHPHLPPRRVSPPPPLPFPPHFYHQGGPPDPRMMDPHLYRMMMAGRIHPSMGFPMPMQVHPPPHLRFGMPHHIHSMPVPQLTPTQVKTLTDALNYTLGELNPELRATCQRIGVSEAQLVHFMSTHQRAGQTNEGASTSAVRIEETEDDSDGLEVLKVVPKKKKKI